MVALDMLYLPSLYARGTYLLACAPQPVSAHGWFTARRSRQSAAD